MNFLERKRIILDLIEEKKSIYAKDLIDILQTSEITIRRDLAELEKRGLLKRSHGGATHPLFAKDPEPVSFKAKSTINIAKKIEICELASKFIKDGDVIYLDCGSTIFQICQFVKNKKIKVITNSIPILYELLGTSVSVILIGGEIDVERQAAHGKTAIEQIGRYHAHKAFISTDGISAEKGLTAKSEIESETAMAMVSNADKVFLLVDSSKIEKDSYLKIAPANIIHALITDKSSKDVDLLKFKKLGLEIYK
jgi:DeoR family transcriptional regulator, fructose operon transcriptional repressor